MSLPLNIPTVLRVSLQKHCMYHDLKSSPLQDLEFVDPNPQLLCKTIPILVTSNFRNMIGSSQIS